MILLFVNKLLTFLVKKKKVKLIIPYLPYARQDRACNLGESFALAVFINSFFSQVNSKIDELVAYDLHSIVAIDLFRDFSFKVKEICSWPLASCS